MWVSVEQAEQGGRITLDLEDCDASGQQVYISKEWLWERGTQWCNATHEDGTLLPVTDLAGGVLVDFHHFSEVYINPDGLTGSGTYPRFTNYSTGANGANEVMKRFCIEGDCD